MKWLYVVQISEGPIKIGVASNPDARLAAMQTDNPYEVRLVHCAYAREDAEFLLHARLKEYRIRGEWFQNHRRVVRALEKFFGVPLSISFGDGPPPDEDAPASYKIVKRTLATGEVKTYRYARRKPDGKRVSSFSNLRQLNAQER